MYFWMRRDAGTSTLDIFMSISSISIFTYHLHLYLLAALNILVLVEKREDIWKDNLQWSEHVCHSSFISESRFSGSYFTSIHCILFLKFPMFSVSFHLFLCDPSKWNTVIPSLCSQSCFIYILWVCPASHFSIFCAPISSFWAGNNNRPVTWDCCS